MLRHVSIIPCKSPPADTINNQLFDQSFCAVDSSKLPISVTSQRSTHLFSPVRRSLREKHMAIAMMQSDATVPAQPRYGIHWDVTFGEFSPSECSSSLLTSPV